ncbi:MAG: translation initiation factor IF-2 [candidate division WOR-3 bacterium]
MEEIKEPHKDLSNSKDQPTNAAKSEKPKTQTKSKEKESKGLKLFVAAKYLNLSCEAFVSILKELGYPPRGFTARITQEEFEKVKARVKQEKFVVKESLKKKLQIPASPQPPKFNSAPKLVSPKIITPQPRPRPRPEKHREREQKPVEVSKKIKVPPYVSVAELASLFGVSVAEIIKKCLNIGLLATVNQRLDTETILLLADEFKLEVEIEEEIIAPTTVTGEPKERPPVVVVMGHVDHGKTSLLDYIRKTKVAEKEYGRITQHTGAYLVHYKDKKITFLDTPGHEAFTAMRARGAQVTDIAVLVVAADDGVMPQTIEAINHARAAGVPIIVAITKCDLATANPEMVKSQLAQHGLRVEGYGGDTLCVLTSVRTGMGIEDLLEAILLLAEELKISAVYDGPAKGVVIESRRDRGRGNIITLLVQQGTLRKGDAFVCGSYYGRVRDLLNENFERLEEATPSIPVQVLGSSGLPEPGERFEVVADERTAREIATRRALLKRDTKLKQLAANKLGLVELQQKIQEGLVKELKIVLKADTFGSAEALKEALEGLSLEEVRVRVIHAGIGQITTSDVLLAESSQAIVIGYHVNALSEAQRIAEQHGVEIRLYRIIYSAIDDIRSAMLGLLEPEEKEVLIGKAEIRQVFMIPKVGPVAGAYITEGKVTRNAIVKIIRDNKDILKSKIISLKRFKDDVKEVEMGFECGIGIENASDLKVGDILEFYSIEKVARDASVRDNAS